MPPDHATVVRDQAMPDVLPGADEVSFLLSGVKARLGARWRAGSELLDEMCEHALSPPGKLFRPVLLLESARALGGDIEMVLPAAVGAESGHVASLVHDDIIDDDDLRRGKPSVQHAFGVGDAIVAGDALIFDLFASLAECRATGVPAERVVSALDVVSHCGIDLCRGQSMESELCRRLDFDAESYLTMVRLKTGALFKASCECGAILAGGADHDVKALGDFAENLGAAFQIHDDLLPYTGDTAVIGKSVLSDLNNGRLTLPVILAHDRSDTAGRRTIERCLVGAGDPVVRWRTLTAIVHQTGGLAAAKALARQFIDDAIAALRVLPPSPSRDRLASFAEAAIERER